MAATVAAPLSLPADLAGRLAELGIRRAGHLAAVFAGEATEDGVETQFLEVLGGQVVEDEVWTGWVKALLKMKEIAEGQDTADAERSVRGYAEERALALVRKRLAEADETAARPLAVV